MIVPFEALVALSIVLWSMVPIQAKITVSSFYRRENQ